MAETTDYSSHFGADNIPFGIASVEGETPKPATRYRNRVIFLETLTSTLTNIQLPQDALRQPKLNDLAAAGRAIHTEIREAIQQLIKDGTINEESGHHTKDVQMHLPLSIDYFVDFSCSPSHNTRAPSGLFGGPGKLPPAYKYHPLGFSGRCASIGISGQQVPRARGQYFTHGIAGMQGKKPGVTYGPTREMDFEMEMAVVVGKPIVPGKTVDAKTAEEHVFGYVLMNDWSARDVQRLEMIPIGPLNSKHSATTISPWVITYDALAPFRQSHPKAHQSNLAPHLASPSLALPSIKVEVSIRSNETSEFKTFGATSTASLDWTFEQLIAHNASTGVGLQPGDIFSVGTISGPGKEEFGCLMELNAEGFERTRGYLEDWEEVRITGVAGEGVGFGECVGRVVANEDESCWNSVEE